MYTYTVERTQIYLSKRELEALDKVARQTGKTRSHLIREAIEEKYVTRRTADEMLAVLRETAGAWGPRDLSSEAYVEELRRETLDDRLRSLVAPDDSPPAR